MPIPVDAMSMGTTGIRWADMTSDSFSRTAGMCSRVGNLADHRADESYLPGQPAPDLENSSAGLNKFFKCATFIGDADKAAGGIGTPALEPRGNNGQDGLVNATARPDWLDSNCKQGQRRMPGFKGLLEQSGGSAGLMHAQTPAKRNRMDTKGITGAGVAAATAVERLAINEDGASKGVASQQPAAKRQKKMQGRSDDCNCRGAVGIAGIEWVSQQQQPRARRRSGRNSWSSKSSGQDELRDPRLLLSLPSAPFLQLPGLMAPVLMPIGMPTGAAPALAMHDSLVHANSRAAPALRGRQGHTGSLAPEASRATPQLQQVDAEEWCRRASTRMKDIAIGKATTGYRNFISTVPRGERSNDDPQTPDPHERTSKATFQRRYQKWRKQLHKYDDHVSAKSANCIDAAAACAVRHNDDQVETGLCVAKGCGETSEQEALDAISAFNRECDIAGL